MNILCSCLSATFFIFSLTIYISGLIGWDISHFDLVVSAILVFLLIPLGYLKWTDKVEGVYRGSCRFVRTRQFFLVVVIAIQIIDVFYLSNINGIVMLGFVMLFSLLTFYSFFFGKVHGTFSWFKFT